MEVMERLSHIRESFPAGSVVLKKQPLTSPAFTNKIRTAYSEKEKELRHRASQMFWQLAGILILGMFFFLILFKYGRSQLIGWVTLYYFLIIGLLGYLFYRWGRNYGKIQAELKKLRISSTLHDLNHSNPDDPFIYFRRD
jgi:hypothetical protein